MNTRNSLILGVVVVILAVSAYAVFVRNMGDQGKRVKGEGESKTQKQEELGESVQVTETQAIAPTEEPMNTKKQYSSPPPMTISADKQYTAMLTTSKGVMRIGLFPKEAPVIVNNFVFLANDGFYNDTVFHRIIRGFMIQGGDPQGSGAGGPGYRLLDEPVTRDYVRGTLAMANAGPNTNGSQFFIMHEDGNLPKSYVIFGVIDPADTTSLATLDAIANVPVGTSPSGEQSMPLEPVTVSSVTIETK